jgi:uncharacterized membrane protein
MFGVPIFLFLSVTFLAILSFVLGAYLSGGGVGLLFAGCWGAVLFGFKMLCENDDRAIDRAILTLKARSLFRGQVVLSIHRDFFVRNRHAFFVWFVEKVQR